MKSVRQRDPQKGISISLTIFPLLMQMHVIVRRHRRRELHPDGRKTGSRQLQMKNWKALHMI